MALFSWGNRNNSSSQSEHNGLFGGKKFQDSPKPDYSKYSDKDLFSQFKSEKWDTKKDEDKIAVLQEIENREAALHNRPAATVIQGQNSRLGGYSSSQHFIEVRLTSNQFEDLDSLFHESEHGNQSKSSNNDVAFSEDDKKLMDIEDMTSSDGKNSHYNKYNQTFYDVMTSELDANNSALEKLVSLKDVFKDEDKYQSYLESRQEYYDSLSGTIEQNRNDKKAALLDTVYCAYIRNELSDSEYKDLQSLINNGNNYDLCEKRASEISDLLSPVDLQTKSNIENIFLTSTVPNENSGTSQETNNNSPTTKSDSEDDVVSKQETTSIEEKTGIMPEKEESPSTPVKEKSEEQTTEKEVNNTEEVQTSEEVNDVEVVPASEEVNDVEEVPASEEVNDVEEVPASEEVNDVEEVPASEEVNDVEEVPASEEVNDVEEVPASEEVNDVEEVPVSETERVTETTENSDMINDLDKTEVNSINSENGSVMIEDLDTGSNNSVSEENASAMIADFGETNTADNSASFSNESSASNNNGMDIE